MTARKLQTEIDRTLKKVAEGIEEFDQIWEKVIDCDLCRSPRFFPPRFSAIVRRCADVIFLNSSSTRHASDQNATTFVNRVVVTRDLPRVCRSTLLPIKISKRSMKLT